MKINSLILTVFCVLVSFFNFSNLEEEIILPCIMYHSVYETRNNDYVISPSKFENDLIYITENNYNTVFISEVIDYNEDKGDLPENPIAITFDDGYYNNFTKVLPLLEKYKVKATINLVGEFCDRDNEIKQHNFHSCLNWKQVEEMSKSPFIEFQNHSNSLHHITSDKQGVKKCNYETLTEYSARLVADAKACENKIFAVTNKVTSCFAYPFGAFSNESHEILNTVGYKAFLTCHEHLNKIKKGENYLVLGRFNRASYYSTNEFFNRVFM